MAVIAKVAIDPRALDTSAASSPDLRIQKRLADTVRDFAILGVTCDQDSEELTQAMRRQAESIGVDFWSPLLRALDGQSAGSFRADPPRAHPTRVYCSDGRHFELNDLVNLVVVGNPGTEMPGLEAPQLAALRGLDGFTKLDQGPELAVAGAVDQCAVIEDVRQVRRESVIPRATSADDVWRRYFETLAQTSTEVNIYDKFLFSGIARSGPAQYLMWILQALDRDLPATAPINLFALTGDVVARSIKADEPNAYKVEDVAALLAGYRNWSPGRTLHIFMAKRLDHDRHIRFSCGHAIMSQAGFDHLEFDKDVLREPFSYTHVPPGESLRHRSDQEGDVRDAARRKAAEHWVLQWLGGEWAITGGANRSKKTAAAHRSKTMAAESPGASPTGHEPQELGRVKWFDLLKGYGAISPVPGGKDIFFHRDRVQVDPAELKRGQAVRFDIRHGDRGPKAVNVRPA